MNIKSYLPSKKIIVAIVTVIVLIIAYVIYTFVFDNKDSRETNNFIDVSLVDQKQDSFYYLDTDNDGAYDWEEALWPELDPNNPDSDGDGVLDGKYIKNKQAIQERERRGETTLESNLSKTEELGRSTLTALMAVANSTGELDAETQAQFSENVANYIGELTLGDTLYTRDQFKLVQDNQINIYAYRDFMQTLFREYPVATSDIELLISATENPDESIGRVSSVSAKYNEYLSELVSIEVPYAIAGRHTELVNSVSQLAAAFDNLLLDEIDELISLSALVQIESIMDQVATALIKINEFFEIVKDPDIFKGPYQ